MLFVIGSLSGGGAERVLSIIANNMVERGIRVRICCVSPFESTPAYKISDKIEYHPLYRYGKDKRFDMLSIMRALRQEAKDFHPDVIVGFMNYNAIYAIVSCLGLRIPIVYRVAANFAWDRRSAPVRFGVRFLYPFFTKGGVYQHERQKADYKSSRRRKDVVIMNPVEENVYWRLPKDYGNKRIVASGRLTEGKNFNMLLRAYALLKDDFPDWTVEICGEGALRSTLDSEIARLGLQSNVFLKGFTSDMPKMLHDASVYVMTSDTEGMPNALMEALAMACACVTTDFDGGAANVLIRNDDTGLIVTKGDHIALAKALRTFMSNEPLRKKIGEAAAKDMRNRANVERITNRWIAFLQEVIK